MSPKRRSSDRKARPNGEAPSSNDGRTEGRRDDRGHRELFAALYDELRRLAQNALKGEGSDAEAHPTALVHEAFVRFVESGCVDVQGRTHFFGTAARIMRHVLVDQARERGAQKRGGGFRQITLHDGLIARGEKSVELLALDDALKRLEELAPRQCQVVEMRFFAGLNVDEIARELDVSPRTVANDWRFARAWLRRELAGDELDESEPGS